MVTQLSGSGLGLTSDLIRVCLTGTSLKCFSRPCRRAAIYLIWETAAGDSLKPRGGRQAVTSYGLPGSRVRTGLLTGRILEASREGREIKLTPSTWACRVFVDVSEAETLPGSQPGSGLPGSRKTSRATATAFVPSLS